jgi:hypothetical protein
MKAAFFLLVAIGVIVGSWNAFHGSAQQIVAPGNSRQPVQEVVGGVRQPEPAPVREQVGHLQRSGGLHDPTEPSLLSIRQELADVKAQLKALRRRLDQQVARFEPLLYEGSSSEDPYLAEKREMEMQQESERRAQERIELLEDYVSTQRIDLEWSPEAVEGIELALADEDLLGTSVSRVDCGATLCRVAVSHGDPQAFSKFQERFLSQVGEMLPDALFEHAESGDGATDTVVYLAREGYELPFPDAGH